MTIFIDADTASNLTTYSGLLVAAQDWLERSDIVDRIPDFVRLAEARFRRELVMPDMEVSTAFTPAATVALPTDFDSIRALGIVGYPPMDQLTPGDFGALPLQPDGSSYLGRPTKFMIAAGYFSFWPVPDTTYSMKLLYRACLPALSFTTQTNWLYAKHPDLYLFATLLQAEFFGWNDERLPLIKSQVDEILSSITLSGVRKRYGSGPLTMKPATHARVGLR